MRLCTAKRVLRNGNCELIENYLGHIQIFLGILYYLFVCVIFFSSFSYVHIAIIISIANGLTFFQLFFIVGAAVVFVFILFFSFLRWSGNWSNAYCIRSSGIIDFLKRGQFSVLLLISFVFWNEKKSEWEKNHTQNETQNANEIDKMPNCRSKKNARKSKYIATKERQSENAREKKTTKNWNTNFCRSHRKPIYLRLNFSTSTVNALAKLVIKLWMKNHWTSNEISACIDGNRFHLRSQQSNQTK